LSLAKILLKKDNIMSLDDMPITEDAQQEPADMPVESNALPELKQVPTDTRNLLSVQAASIASDLDPEVPLFESFQRISQGSNDVKTTLKGLSAQKAQQEKQDFLSVFKDQPGETREDVAENYAAVSDIVNSLDEEGQDEDLMFIKSASKGKLTPDVEKRLAVQLKLSKMMKETWDDMSKGDVALDVLGMVIPGNILKDNFDLSGNAFSAEEYMYNFVLNFKQLPPDTQLEILPTVRAVLSKDLDNNLKVMNVLDKLLTAGGEDDLSDFNGWWATLDIVDIATLGTATMLKVAQVTKGLNASRVLSGAGDVEGAADVTAAAVVSEGGVAQAANLDRATTAVSEATGFNLSNIDPAQAGNLSVETMQRIQMFDKQVEEMTEAVSGSDLFIREGLLQRAERSAVEQSIIDERKILPGVDNVRVLERKDGVSVIGYDLKKTDGTTVPLEYNMQLTLDDVGVYEQGTIGLLSKWAASPSVWAKKNVRQEVDAAIRADSAQAKIFEQLADMNREATKTILGPLGLKGLNPASRKKLAQLDHVLQTGDHETKVYTPLELAAGVDGVKLDEKQIEAYYKMRSVVNSLFTLRNNTKREELRIKGMKNVNFQVLDESGEVASEVNHIGRPYITQAEGQGALNTSKPNVVWDNSINEFVLREDIDLTSIYTHNGRLVKFLDAITPPNTGEKVNFAIVYDGITRLPDTVLHRRVGYIPKINNNVSYFVKEFKATRVDGQDIAATEAGAQVDTIRFFDNRKEADAWLANFEKDNPGVYRVLEDRQLEQERRAGNVDGPGVGGHGLYTGPRSADDIPFGKDGVATERVGSFEAIGRNLSSVAKYVPRNAWRLGMEQRALNTANVLLPGGDYKTFTQLASVPDTESGRFIKKLHDQIEEWMGFPTKEEQLWSAMVQGTYDTMAGTKLPGLKGLLYLKHKDPIAAARSAAFHSLLGWFNPIQLWVQAQGASVAVATNLFRPLELANSIRLTQALAAVDHLENTKAIAHTAKAFGMKADELMEMKRLWSQTGLKESILTTADHAAAAVGHGIAMDALARTSNKGLMFYRAGELFNRRLSFTTALRKWQQDNVGKAVKTEDLKDILTRSNNLMLGLTRANRAQWQKGVWSIPTQFLQISTKTMEALLGFNGNFTAAERGKILMGQLMLYGAAGIPLGGMGANWLVQSMGYTSQADIEQNLDPLTRKAINEGFEGWASMAMFGIDIDVGTRASLASGINQTLDRFLFDDSTLAEQFMGAFGSSATRFWRGMSGAFEPLSGGLAETRAISNPLAVVGDLAKTLSTWNNASKGLFMHRYDMIVDRHGNPVVRRDFKASEEVARAIGFRPTQEVQAFELRDIIQAKEQLRKDVIDSIVQVYWDYSLKATNDELTENYKQLTRDRMALLYQSLDTNFERQQAREAVQKRLGRGTDLFSKQWQKTRQLWNDGQVNMLLDWHSKLTTRGILQQRGPDQERE
jgi:hypothetical protein